jgi:nitrous oxidase accessory protein NosD
MKTRIALVLSVALAVAAPSAEGAARAGAWKGKATSPDGTFKYGKVTFRVKGNTVRNLKIEAVTVSGCGGFTTIVVPKLTIKGTKLSGSYKPLPDSDQIIIVTGTISGTKARAKFTAGPTCVGEGKFTARPA